jgi:hypothetical protein
MSPQPMPETCFTVDDVAESLQRWIASGELVAHWLGRSPKSPLS